MKINFTVMMTTLFTTTSFKQRIPKLCINCKHFINDEISSNKYGKCILFPVINDDENNDFLLVNGLVEKKEIEYNFCVISRNDETMCGKNGEFYEFHEFNEYDE